MLGKHSATELATLEPLGSIPIRLTLGAKSPLPCSHACPAPSGASHLSSVCRKKLLSVARAGPACHPAPGASEYKIHKRKYKIYTGTYINKRSTQESGLLLQSTNVGHVTETAQWEQCVPEEDRKQAR